jgi:hypothetical protein
MQFFCELHEYMLVHGLYFCGSIIRSVTGPLSNSLAFQTHSMSTLPLGRLSVEAALCLADMSHRGLAHCLQ